MRLIIIILLIFSFACSKQGTCPTYANIRKNHGKRPNIIYLKNKFNRETCKTYGNDF